MLFKGKKLQEPNRATIYIPRGDNDEDTIILTVQAILDMTQFNSLCPEPKPPLLMLRGGENRPDTSDPQYLQRLEDINEKRMAYYIIKSLEATKELQWETVDINDPETWKNYIKELQDSGFSDMEVKRIVMAIYEVNAITDSRINKARDSFLAGRAAQDGLLSHSSGANGTLSGESVSD